MLVLGSSVCAGTILTVPFFRVDSLILHTWALCLILQYSSLSVLGPACGPRYPEPDLHPETSNEHIRVEGLE